VQNLFTNAFRVNSLNELTTVGRGGNFTAAGTAGWRATNVTVNTLAVLLQGDVSFVRTNVALTKGDN
jgi:hypothetical protein